MLNRQGRNQLKQQAKDLHKTLVQLEEYWIKRQDKAIHKMSLGEDPYGEHFKEHVRKMNKALSKYFEYRLCNTWEEVYEMMLQKN